MKINEMIEKPKSRRSGIIPYYWNGAQLMVYCMRPSDPAYGGTAWQMAKGKVEPNLTTEENAFKEAKEELGLKRENVKNMQLLSKTEYRSEIKYSVMEMFMCEVIDPKNFGPFHYETGAIKWIKLPQELGTIRNIQQSFFEKLMSTVAKPK